MTDKASKAFADGKKFGETGVFNKNVEDDIINEWHIAAKEIKSSDELKVFIDKLLATQHDYNSIAEAFIAALTATMHTMDSHENGGITGFQQGHIVTKFVSKELMLDGPWRLQKYDDMLFPQYAFKFEKVITADVWTYLKDEAQKRLADFNKDEDTANPQVVQHWKNIVGGKIPFGYVVKF